VIELPAGWRWSTVAEVGTVDLGRQRHPDWHEGPEMRRYLRVANVFENRIDTTDLKEMDFSGVSDRFKLEPGDVLLNEGQTPELLGRPAIYRGDPPDVAFTNSLLRFRAGPDVLPEWALIVFRRHMHVGRFTRESRITTNIAHLSAGRFKTVEFPVPPLDVQRRIVDIVDDHLSRLESVLATCRATIKRLTRLRQAELNVKFGLNGQDWVTLGDLLLGIQAGRSLGNSAPPAKENEWGIIKVSAMTWGEFRPHENKSVPESQANPNFEIMPGDLLVSRANTSEYVGAPVLVGDVRRRLLLSDKSLRLLPKNDVHPEWLWRALQAPSARRQISAAATGTKDSMRNISQKSLMGVRLPRVEPDAQRWLAKSYAERDFEIKRIEQAAISGRSRVAVLQRSVLVAAYSGALNDRTSGPGQIEEFAGV
jgi:type I restriction enzyme S subunit